MAFDQSAAEEFLAEPNIAVVAVTAPSGPPAAVPVWFSYTDGLVTMITEPTSRKGRLIIETGELTLVVQTTTPTNRFVSLDLEMIDHRPSSEKDMRAMAQRYLSGAALDGYMQFAAENLDSEHVFTLRPTHWRFAQLG